MSKRIVGFLLLLMSSQVFSADTKALDQVSLRADLINHLVEMGIGLAFVITAILGALWLLRYFLRGNFIKNNNMKVIGTLPLSTKEKLLLINVDGVRILLGVSPGNIQGIHVFESNAVINSDNADKGPVMSNAFYNKMQEALTTKK